MAEDQDPREQLLKAVDAALAGNWETVHGIVQRLEGHPVANWLHGLHHKREGENTNARYWYDRSPMDFDRFPDPKVELRAIFAELTQPR